MEFRFHQWPDGGKTCSHCAAELHSGWEIDGAIFGPTCGKAELIRRGVKWPKKFGPGAFDREAIRWALEMARYDHRRQAWVHGHTERQEAKMLVGSMGWDIILTVRSMEKGDVIRLGSDEAMKCYDLVREVYKEAK